MRGIRLFVLIKEGNFGSVVIDGFISARKDSVRSREALVRFES